MTTPYRHPERSRGIPWRTSKVPRRDPSAPLRFAQDGQEIE